MDSPSLYLYELDFRHKLGRFVEMTECSYRASTFLGGPRLVRASDEDHTLPLDQLMAACGHDTGPMHYLFHIGHCGSTLLSRMLGELPGLFCLREPRPLMSLALYRRRLGQQGYELTEAQWREHLCTALTLLSRSWRDGDTALVKPNSHSNNLMVEELRWARGRVLMLQVNLETWLATVLIPDKRDELRHFSELRTTDLARMLELPPGTFSNLSSDAELAAVTWLSQLLEFHLLLQQPEMADRNLRVDFDTFVEEPERVFAAVAAHLGLQIDDEMMTGALALMNREHAKHPGQSYDAARRRDELAASLSRHEQEIVTARAWAEACCRKHPRLADAVGNWM